MRLIVGLGNPGRKYRLTKHNVGFLVLEKIAKENRIRLVKRDAYRALVGKGEICGKSAMLLLPQTYMNLSGQAVAVAKRKDVKSLDDMIVIGDDINLELGRVRIRKKGSSGGHKGLKSVIEHLGTNGFARMRMGIATGIHRGDLADYVLEPFTKKDLKTVSGMVDRAEEAVGVWIECGIEAAMSRFNPAKL
ncbi:aminoacyl-tRNA hydrolase [Candidatus Omnitrophota bacterium]